MGNYDDIIDLPHYEPKNRKRMSMYSRAAQFAPFAALTGFDKAIKTTEDENIREWEEDGH